MTDRLERLRTLTDAALAHLSLNALLEVILVRVRDLLGSDTAAILILDGDVLRVRAAKGLEEAVERGVTIPVGAGFAGRIAAERRPVAIEDVEHADILNPVLREKGVRSLLGVPLLVEGRVTGVLHVGTLRPRTFTPEDAELLQAAADRAALAIDHVRLLEEERDARARAEQTTARLSALQAVTEAALAHLSLDDLLEALLDRVRSIADSDTAAILMLDGDVLRARAAKGLEEEVERGVTIPVGKGFAGRIAAERRAVSIEDVEHADILNPLLREKGVRSLLGVPLLVEGRVIGVLHVGTLHPRVFTAEDAELLQAAADRAALAIEHARMYEAEHDARLAAEQRAPAAAALEYVADGVFLLDDHGLIRFWNPAAAAITGVRAELAVGRPINEVISGWESVKPIVPVALSPTATRAETVPMEIEGREYWLSISGVGFEGGTVYAFRDVSDEQRLDEWQNEFIATISHELRTPMASIFGSAQTLMRTDVEIPEATRAELLNVIQQESGRLARLINDVLMASRIQTGKIDVSPTAFDASALVENVLAAARSNAPASVDLRLNTRPALPHVDADGDKVRHVLTNLIENAVKYSPEGGTVEVRLEPQERHMRFAVRDDGLGIPPHERGHIFEKFYRVHEHSRRGIGGTGLGLYICRELVRRMRGRIWVESKEGRGSTFFFELPLAVEPGERAA